jgi:hypothetical protein
MSACMSGWRRGQRDASMGLDHVAGGSREKRSWTFRRQVHRRRRIRCLKMRQRWTDSGHGRGRYDMRVHSCKERLGVAKGVAVDRADARQGARAFKHALGHNIRYRTGERWAASSVACACARGRSPMSYPTRVTAAARRRYHYKQEQPTPHLSGRAGCSSVQI